MAKLGQKRGPYRVRDRSGEVPGRFWPKVDRSGGPDACWPWLAYRGPLGYGRFQITSGVSAMAYRVAYELEVGPIPAGLQLRHRCDNPPCVNPAHLVVGTAWDNAQDMVSRGRVGERRGEANGHARLTEDDVRTIRALSGIPAREIGARFGIRPVTVYAIRARRLWRHVA